MLVVFCDHKVLLVEHLYYERGRQEETTTTRRRCLFSPDHVFVQMFSSRDVFYGHFFPRGFVHHQSRLTKIPFPEKNRMMMMVFSSSSRSIVIINKDGRVFRVVHRFEVVVVPFGSSIVVSILRRHGERESQQSSSFNTNCGNFTIRDPPVREWSVSFQNRASVCR